MAKIKLDYKGVLLEIEYDYQPAEKAETGHEAQYPGCGEEVEVCSINHKGTDMFELLEGECESIESEILESIHSDNY